MHKDLELKDSPNLTNSSDQSSVALDEESLKNFIEQAELKFASYTTIDPHLKQELATLLEDLKGLAQHLMEKETEIQDKCQQITDKVAHLRTYKQFPEDADVRNIFAQAVQEYHSLIHHAIEEIIKQGSFFNRHLAEGEKKMLVPKETTDERIEHEVARRVTEDIQALKSYLKRRKKELAVFFSRYDHGFNVHMQRLNGLEYQLEMYSKS